MKMDICVIGLGIFGRQVAKQLSEHGHTVLAIDRNPHVVDQIKDLVAEAVTADAVDEDALKELDVAKNDVVILGFSDNFEHMVLTAALLKRFEVKKIIAKANTTLQQEILEKIGVDEVYLPEREIAHHLARALTSPSITDVIPVDDDVSIATVKVPEKLAGQSIIELDLRAKHNITAILHKTGENGRASIIRNPHRKLTEGDELVVAGEEKVIAKVFSD